MICCVYFFFFKQKTAYELRISDWSSDVCSSDLKVGPSLYDVIGRAPASVEGFSYSKAMEEFAAGHVWDEATLSSYLESPRGVVKGTKMAFVGLKKEEDRADVIAYLQQFSQ